MRAGEREETGREGGQEREGGRLERERRERCCEGEGGREGEIERLREVVSELGRERGRASEGDRQAGRVRSRESIFPATPCSL
jgi:hypothetical protein